jgi:LEA14-like dessication related protein
MGAIAKLVGLSFLILIIWLGYAGYSISQGISQLEARWGPVSEDETSILISGSFQRPLYLPISLKGAEVVFMNESVAKLGKIDYSMTSPNFTAEIIVFNRKIVDAFLKYLENGEEGYLDVTLIPSLFGAVSTKLHFSVPVREKILESIHLSAPSQNIADLPGVKTPELKDTIVKYNGREGDKAVFTTALVLYNPNPYPVPVLKTAYKVWANGLAMASGGSEKTIIIPAKGSVELPLKTYVNVSAIPKVWEMHVKNEEESTVRAKLYMRVQLSIPLLGTKTRDVELTTVNKTIRTNIMESLNEALSEVSSGE